MSNKSCRDAQQQQKFQEKGQGNFMKVEKLGKLKPKILYEPWMMATRLQIKVKQTLGDANTFGDVA